MRALRWVCGAVAGRGEGGERVRCPAARLRTDHPRVAGVERHD